MSEYREITGQYRKYWIDEPLANATINVKLLENSFTLAATYPTSATAGTDAGQNFQTDSAGNLPSGVKLLASGLAVGTVKKYKFTDPDGFSWEAVLPPGTSPISIQELRANGVTSAAQDTVLALIGNTDLEDLRDVEFNALTDGDAVVWDEAQQKFVNRQISGGSGGAANLNGLSDVVIASPTDGDFLTRVGGVFVNHSLANVKMLLGLDGKADKANVIRSTTSTAPLLVFNDVGKEIRATAAAAKAVSVPSTSILGTDFICAVLNLGAGALTFNPSAGVTIRNNVGSVAQYKTVTIRAIGTDEYLVTGEIV